MAKSTVYVVRVGTQTKAGDGYCWLARLDPTAYHPYTWVSRPALATRFHGREEAESAALELYRLMLAAGYTPPVRIVPATGGVETAFRPEAVG